MNKRIFEAIIGALILILVGGLIGYVSWYTVNKPCYPIIADFSDVSGISTGSQVTVAGVMVGSVTAIHYNAQSNSVEVKMCIQNHIKIPIDSSAVISSIGLIGEKNIKLNFGSSKGTLKAGEEISYTEPSFGLEALISKFIFTQ